MKKLLILAVALLSVSAFSQNRLGNLSGRISIGNGESTVRISVGSQQSNRNLVRRVRRLEQAVMDLQNRVYELQSGPVVTQVDVYTCSLKTPFDGTFYAEANLKSRATREAVRKCEAKAGSFYCKPEKVKCVKETQSVY